MVLAFETLHVTGLCLLFFGVFPDMDSFRAVSLVAYIFAQGVCFKQFLHYILLTTHHPDLCTDVAVTTYLLMIYNLS